MDIKTRAQKYKIVIEWDETKREFIGEAPELGDCLVSAKTQKEAINLVNDAIERQLSTLEEQHLPPPVPFSEKRFSGKITLRVDPAFHRDLAMQANREGISMAHFIERKLRTK